jgi:hypothetical protein
MAAEQPDWLKLPFDLLEPIAQRSRDAVTGLDTFRSVCRTWRSAVTRAAAPRLLLPVPQNGSEPLGGSKYALLFPLSRGWSIIIDARDVSCHLKHLPTGAMAVLPNLNTVRNSFTSEIENLDYEHAPESDREEAHVSDEDSCGDDSVDQDQETPSFDGSSACGHPDDNDECSAPQEAPCPEEISECGEPEEHSTDEEAPATHDDECSTDQDVPSTEDYSETTSQDGWYRRHNLKIKIKYLWYHLFFDTHLSLSDVFNFAIHVPPGTLAASTEGMVIIMYHMLQGNTGMVFCRPGDAAWTKIANPNSEYLSFTDFAYFEGKMLALDDKGVTLVFDATTLHLLYQVDVPPATPNVSCKIFDYALDEFHCLRLVALPSKVLLVKIRVKSAEPEGFDIFELSSGPGQDDGRQHAWRKLNGDNIGGSHELFLDCYHNTFRDAHDGRGTRIYFHDDFLANVGSGAAYCYNVKDDKLECVYMPSAEDNGCIYSTRPSWYVPTN